MNILIAFLFLINISFAKCQWKTIEKNDKGFNYSKDCHIEVGKRLTKLDIKTLQYEKQKEALELKDLAITETEKKSQMWKEEAENQNKLLNEQAKKNKTLNKIYFAGGVLGTVLGVFLLNSLQK